MTDETSTRGDRRQRGAGDPGPFGAAAAPAAGLLNSGHASLDPVKVHTAAELIADRLTTAIALGEFVPGQRLPTERELAAMLGVSRATIREALQRLVAAGSIVIRRGRHGGAFVENPWGSGSEETVQRTLIDNWTYFEQLLEFRQVIEPAIARMAAERATDEDRAAISEALRQYREAGDRAASRAADEALHLAVARACRNDYLVNVSRHVRTEVSLGFSAEPYSDQIRERAVHDHADLAEAVLAGDGDRAAEVARRHFTITSSALADLVARVRGRSGSGERADA